MKEALNPFLAIGYRGPEYFCDRIKELDILKRNIKNQINTTLFAKRRLGKTGLLKHLFFQIHNQKTICIYVDISATQNLKEFTNEIATSVYNAFPSDLSIGKKIIAAIKLLRPTINFDELTGNPVVSIDAVPDKKPESNIQQIFTFLDKQNFKIVFAIDEFQQILEYPEKNTEAILRSIVQQLKNTQFIFCGSNQKLMHQIFNQAKRPFFASCSTLHLDIINREEYELFIRNKFSEHKMQITDDCLKFILSYTCNHTFYTQYFCNYLFAKKNKINTLGNAFECATEILSIYESTFFQYRNLLTDAQWKLLKAIALEHTVYQLHSRDFIVKHELGTSSLVTRGIQALLEKEMIYHEINTDKPYYEVYDKFLMRWLQRL